jgi:DNA-directed RNA polymerase specialized sigma24 family protein
VNTAEPELAFLLEAYQLRDPELSERFHDVAAPILRRMAKRHGYGLPKHAIDDVIQETFLSLSNSEILLFYPSRSTASQYLLGRVLNAVKTIQIIYGLRRAGSDFDSEPQREFVAIEDMNLTSTLDVPVGAILARHTVQKVFASLDGGLRSACMRVYGDDESQESVAADMNISRFALARKLSGVKAMALHMMAAA